MLFSIALLFLSFMGTPSLFIKRFPSLGKLYYRVKSSQEVIGAVYCAYGILNLLSIILKQQFDVLRFITVFCMVIVGFLLSRHWITKNVFGSNYEVSKTVNKLNDVLSPFGGTLSIALFFMSIYYLIF